MENSDVLLGLHDFLERMRQPSASDFVKSIKSFLVSFLNNAPDPNGDSALVQEFFSKMEAAFRAHPLWAGCSEEELDSAGEGLEKYVMTKLFTRVFASLPDEAKVDQQLSQKMSLIQQFIRPENLDIKPAFENETSWLLAQKELQKINMYKAPRDKLVCILNCCKVINNLLLNASIASNENPPGADEFLPVLIYVTIKANPPQLHSNLLYIQRYRRQSRLVAEAAYFFTNMLSAESFISNIDAKALSMDATEYERNMEFAQALLTGLSADSDNQSDTSMVMNPSAKHTESKLQASVSKKGKHFSGQSKSSERIPSINSAEHFKDESSMLKIPSLSDIENKGATMILKEDMASQVFREYPYLFSKVGDLTINDVEDLLNNYKQLVFKYVCLSKGLGVATPSIPLSESETHRQDTGALDLNDTSHDPGEGGLQESTSEAKNDDQPQEQVLMMDSLKTVSHPAEENVESKTSEAQARQSEEEAKDGTS